ncbi:MAG: hypothetical protein KF718_25265 [Polyangiaceae bacterium]|nr:hypothetical protein [Polyangiaceae bacterium]
MKRSSRLSLCVLFSLGVSCSDDDPDAKVTPKLVPVKGVAAIFNDAVTGRIADATVSVVEHPEMQVTTGADGLFSFGGLREGEDVTLVLEHPDYPLIQTGTHRLGSEGIEDFTFQVPTQVVYDLLASIVAITPDPTRCQMVTTITRHAGTILEPGAHGEPDVTVSLAPGLASEHGPIYFNASVIPDKALTQSSEDGGVLFVNVAPGHYVLSGHKAGTTLGKVRFKCRPGVLVNASPPRGMNVL